jgi:fumarylpyruvate hydrolase
MSFVFTPAVASVPVQSSSELFPVHRIYCVGRNYVEHAIEMGHSGRDISATDAMAHVWGYAVGLDMTRRDLQAEAKKLGRPWCIAKGFDESAPIGPIRRATETELSADSVIHLDVNGAKRQSSTLGKLIWSVPEIIEHISIAWELAPGDLIFTGTPEGVAAVEIDDTLEGRIDGVGSLKVQVVK